VQNDMLPQSIQASVQNNWQRTNQIRLYRAELQMAWHAYRFGRGGVHPGELDIQTVHSWVSFT
jgi:hypothetical protein